MNAGRRESAAGGLGEGAGPCGHPGGAAGSAPLLCAPNRPQGERLLPTPAQPRSFVFGEGAKPLWLPALEAPVPLAAGDCTPQTQGRLPVSSRGAAHRLGLPPIQNKVKPKCVLLFCPCFLLMYSNECF